MIYMKDNDYTKINSATIDRWVEEGWEWGRPISHGEFEKARRGIWDVRLTPVKTVPKDWFLPMRGSRILGLASGGAQQMPIFAALGAECYVLDISRKQLESEQEMARIEGYQIHTYQEDMTKPLPFENGFFDMIFHPVSNCYIRDVVPVWKECFRVLKKGGRLLSGLDNGLNYLFDDEESGLVTGHLPFNPLEDPEQMRMLEEQGSGIQFSHTIAEQIGGQIHAGFRLLDVYDDTNGSGFLHEHGAPAFWASLAEKSG